MRRLLIPVLLALGFGAHAQDLVIYDDALRNDFVPGYSYGGGTDLAHAITTRNGSANSIAFVGNNFNAVAFPNEVRALSTAQYSGLRFFVHGGTAGGQQLRFQLYSDLGATLVANVELDPFIESSAIAANLWRQVDVPFAALPYAGGFQRVDLQADGGGAQPALYLDDVRLIAALPRIFADGFEGNGIPAVGEIRFVNSAGNLMQTVGENVGLVTWQVERVNGSQGAVSVDLQIAAGGTASAPDDYSLTSATASWANGEAGVRNLTLTVVDDGLDENSESANLQLGNASGGATIAAPSSATLTITDNDNPPAANVLQHEQGVVVGAMTSDRFTWRDGLGMPRVAVLAHNDGQVGPDAGVYANRGGALREFRYRLPGNIERVVIPNASGNTGFGGFGYVVSHRNQGSAGGVVDDSPLGYSFAGSFQRVATGRHHALFRFTQNYPRHTTTTATPASTRFDVPITIDWLFATGRDHPLWAVTYDLGAAVPAGLDANELNDDSRAPYGELMFDGAANEAARSLTAGVGWGDRFKFTTTPDAGPVTYNSAWAWDVPNTVPYVKLWTTAVDATMGVVQTQTIVQHDAGGYFGTSEWGDTSATVPLACTFARGNIDTTMPCDYNWPYQSINYEMNHFVSPNNTTRSQKLAWGTNFGFLGRTAYPIHGSSHPEIGGPVAGNPTASGWPRQSYSTYVVLGRHSDDPVGLQVAEIEAVQQTAFSASVGTVASQGIAGAGRIDTVAYQPIGWDHVYGVWTVDAATNRATTNFAVGGGRTLENPVLKLRNWQGAALPAQVSLNGNVLEQDVDYFPSVFDATDELLITLNRTLAGTTNQVVITP